MKMYIYCRDVKDIQDYEFLRWIDQVEELVYREIGLELLDLQDELYMYNYECGWSATEMAEEVIETNNFYLLD